MARETVGLLLRGMSGNSGFSSEADGNCALLCSYAASSSRSDTFATEITYTIYVILHS